MCGTVIVPYNTFLVYLASCSCIHGKSFFHFHIIGRSCKSCIEYSGGKLILLIIGMLDVYTFELCFVPIFIYEVVYCFFAVLSIGMVGWGLYRCHEANDNYNILATLIQAKLWSFAEWFIWTGPYFAFRYPIDRKLFYSSLFKKSSSQRSIGSRSSSERNVATEGINRESSASSITPML